jgi:intracellular multiplication protein IcmB
MSASVLDRIGQVMDDALHRASSFFGQTIDGYCDLTMAEVTSKYALADYRGGLVSLIDIGGVATIPGKHETEQVIDRIVSELGPFLSQRHYAVQIVFEYDPDEETGEHVLERHLFHLKRGAAHSGLTNVDDLVDDLGDQLSKHVAFERCTLAVFSSPSLTRPKTAAKEQVKNAPKKKANLPVGNGYSLRKTLNSVADAHDAFASQVEDTLRSSGISCHLMEQHEACARIRQQIDPEFTAPEWRPTLPGDPLPLTDNGRPDPQPADLLWTPLHRQLIPRDPQQESMRTVRIGNRIYQPLQVEVAPKDTKPFAKLFSTLRRSKTPYRLSIRIYGDAISKMNGRNQLASSMTFAGSQNKRIQQSFKALEKFVKDSHGTGVCVVIDGTTWCTPGNEDELSARLNRMGAALQAWGGAEVDEMIARAADSVFSSAVGLRLSSASNTNAMSLSKALMLSPLMRPYSPWTTGTSLLRTPDGKLFPYRAYSSLQNAWITHIVAPMGRGKSVAMNALNLALCMDEGNKELPIIRMLDIGYSSAGLISLLRASLPAHRKHEALYRQLRNSEEDAINIMDTHLGCRAPIGEHRAFLVDLICMFATPMGTGDKKVPEVVAGIAGMVIDEAYKRYSDGNKPKPYNRKVDPVVDAAIEKRGIEVDSSSTWFEITDALFDAGAITEAYLAHYQAMPRLSELAAIAKEDFVANVYTGTHDTGEPMGHYFWRMMMEIIAEYPMLNKATKFNLGAARVVSLDLQNVAPSGGAKAQRQTSIMYTVAMWALNHEFFLSQEDLGSIPQSDLDRYESYYLRRIESLGQSPKRVCADEYHRAAPDEGVRNAFIRIVREGRKHRIEVMLASQNHTDYDDIMLNLGTVRLVFGAGEGEGPTLAKRLGMPNPESTAHVIAKQLNGPSSKGTNVLAQFVTKKQGTFTQLLTMTLGPRWLWAFSSSKEDVGLRDRLYSRLGDSMARQVLALSYPSGSVMEELERRNSLIDSDQSDYGDSFSTHTDPVRQIEQEMIELANRLKNKAREQRIREQLGESEDVESTEDA